MVALPGPVKISERGGDVGFQHQGPGIIFHAGGGVERALGMMNGQGAVRGEQAFLAGRQSGEPQAAWRQQFALLVEDKGVPTGTDLGAGQQGVEQGGIDGGPQNPGSGGVGHRHDEMGHSPVAGEHIADVSAALHHLGKPAGLGVILIL